MNACVMRRARLHGIWFYERAVTNCLCRILTAGRTPLHIGEEIYCEKHDRVAIVNKILPATLAEQDAICAVEPARADGCAPKLSDDTVN